MEYNCCFQITGHSTRQMTQCLLTQKTMDGEPRYLEAEEIYQLNAWVHLFGFWFKHTNYKNRFMKWLGNLNTEWYLILRKCFFSPLEKSSYLLEMCTIEMIWSLGVCLKFLYSVKMVRGDSVCWSLLILGDELSTWGSLDCLPCFGMHLKTSINKLFF